mgnify:CR=1 FL=1
MYEVPLYTGSGDPLGEAAFDTSDDEAMVTALPDAEMEITELAGPVGGRGGGCARHEQ